MTGDQSFGPSFNGRTISNMDFRGWVTVTGANITFKNSIFRGRAANGANHALLNTEHSTGTITIMDSEFAPSAPSATIDGLCDQEHEHLPRRHPRRGGWSEGQQQHVGAGLLHP